MLLSSDFTKPFVVCTDACDSGFDESGIRHLIVYISKKLQPRREKYATIEKECWAFVWCINKLKLYLYRRTFTVETDGASSVQVARLLMKDKNAKLYSGAALQGYEFQVKHSRKGRARRSKTLERES